MVKIKGFSASTPEYLGQQIDEWFMGKNFSSLDIQYKVFNDPNERLSKCRFSALVVYEDGEDYIVSS